MRKIAILAATLAAPCWILAASAQNQAVGVTGNRTTTDMQNLAVGIGQPEFAFGANDMSVIRSGTGPTAGALAPGGMERQDLGNRTAATAGFATANPAIK